MTEGAPMSKPSPAECADADRTNGARADHVQEEEFGHNYFGGKNFRIDSWGSGPFLMTVDGKLHRFEDSDRFGPIRCNKNGAIAVNDTWPEKHRFWVAYSAWRKAGRRLASDGSCIWDEPKPTIVHVKNRIIGKVLQEGDEELAGIFDQHGRMVMRPQSGPLS